MNAPAKIALSFETVAEAMDREGIYQIRNWRPVGRERAFTVELKDGRAGGGKTIRAAINDAQAKPVKVAA